MRKSYGREEKRYLRAEHLEKNSFLVFFSPSKKGLFCRTCVLFADIDQIKSKSGKENGIYLSTRALLKYTRLFGENGYITKHSKTFYHETAVQKANDFMKFFRKPDKAIDLQWDSQVREVARNRRALKPIIESILFCAKLGLPLRRLGPFRLVCFYLGCYLDGTND